jgi:hypothetical protein
MKIPTVPGSRSDLTMPRAGLLDPVALAKHHIGIGITAATGGFRLRNHLITVQLSAMG